MKNPSGSGIERAVNCAASYALNQAPDTGAAAIKGTANHSDVEGELVDGDISKYGVVRQAVEAAAELHVEEAYAIDVEAETVRYIGERLGRDYGPLGPSEIALTIDLRCIMRNGTTWVWDWKSRKRVTSAEKNLQLRAGCVAVMKAHGLTKVHGGLGYLSDDEIDIHSFDSFDAAVFFEDMRKMLNRIGAARALVATGGTPEVHSGPWCQYCPALAYCPAQTRLAKTMLGELMDVEKEVAFMTSEQAGKAWTLLKQIQGLADRVEASLKLRARQDVVPLPNGKRLALVDCSRSSFDKKKALAWIKERGGDPAEFEGRTHYEQIKEINMPKAG